MSETEWDVQNRVPQWVAAFLRYAPGRKIHLVECAGTQVSASWILTAAHAVIDVNTTTVLLGTDQLSSGQPGWMRRIETVIRHPQYDPLHPAPLQFDLALVKLAMPFQGDRKFVTLRTTGHFSGHAEVFGWGERVGVPGFYSNRMKQIPVAIGQTDSSGLLRAKSVGTINTCYGDSGAPLLVRANGGWEQVGITSSLTVKRECRQASVYTPVAPYIGWIEQTIATNQGAATAASPGAGWSSPVPPGRPAS
jgi:secreted trypsin-like serine protease